MANQIKTGIQCVRCTRIVQPVSVETTSYRDQYPMASRDWLHQLDSKKDCCNSPKHEYFVGQPPSFEEGLIFYGRPQKIERFGSFGAMLVKMPDYDLLVGRDGIEYKILNSGLVCERIRPERIVDEIRLKNWIEEQEVQNSVLLNGKWEYIQIDSIWYGCYQDGTYFEVDENEFLHIEEELKWRRYHKDIEKFGIVSRTPRDNVSRLMSLGIGKFKIASIVPPDRDYEEWKEEVFSL